MKHPMVEAVRVALFGSYWQGLAVANQLMEVQAECPQALRLVGCATDDPTTPRVNAHKRIWRFSTPNEYSMMSDLLSRHDTPVWTGSVKGDDFFEAFSEGWKPDLCYVATFGQRIPLRVIDVPRLGIYNFHPSVDREWPSYVGGDPFGGMIAAGEPHCSLAMHVVDEEFDHGPLVAFSERTPIGPDDTILSMYKKTSLETARMLRWHLGVSGVLPIIPDYRPKMASDVTNIVRVA